MKTKKRFLWILVALVVTLASTSVFAESGLDGVEIEDYDVDGPGADEIGIDDELFMVEEGPQADASPWARVEIVDAERYGLYSKDIYKDSLKDPLAGDVARQILAGLEDKIEKADLDKISQVNLLEIQDSKTREGFLQEIYNRLLPYEDQDKTTIDPIIYLSQAGIVKGSNGKFHLDREITTEEAILLAKRAIDYIFELNNKSSKGLMWQVENKGNTAYLLGSIHFGDSSLYPLSQKIMARFNESDELYVEVDISDQEAIMEITMELMEDMMEKIMESTVYTDGRTLESVVGEDLYGKIKGIMDDSGIDEEVYRESRPGNVIEILNNRDLYQGLPDDFGLDEDYDFEEEFDFNQDYDWEEDQKAWEDIEPGLDQELEEMEDIFGLEGFDFLEGPDYGIDMYFLEKAKAVNKEIKELESIEMQMDLLFGNLDLLMPQSGLSEEEEIEKLRETVEAILNPEQGEEGEEETVEEFSEEELMELLEEQFGLITEMMDSIKDGDEEKLLKILEEEGGLDILGDSLIGERDVNMAKKIADLLEADGEKTYFIVVGAAHYIVDGTILDNLRDMGYEIERLH